MQSVRSVASSRAVMGYAASMSRPQVVDVRTVTFREPAAGEVRVRIEGCGVCASSLALWQGKPWFKYPNEPGAPGHEAWGRIDAVGKGVDDLRVGDRVAMLSSHAFAEYDLARAAEVVQLPAELDNTPVPAEPLGCAFNVFKRANIRAGETVAIVGVGFLGTLLTQLAAKAGAHVLAVSHRSSSLKLAEEFGAAATIEIDEEQPAVWDVRELTQGRGCECVIEAAGTQKSLDLASEITSERGRLVIAGYHQDGPRQVNMQLWNWRGLDVINAHERDPQIYISAMREAVAALRSGLIDPQRLYTHTFTLDQLGGAFEMLDRSPEGFVKALVKL